MEMVQRLFLDGVDGECTGVGIDVAIEGSFDVSSAFADSRLATCYTTMVRTKQAFYCFVVQVLIVFALLNCQLSIIN